jgi:hypothetical protein
LVAIGRVASASAPPSAPAATEAQKRAAFADLAAHEGDMRRRAAKDFPSDLWSQDDAFHAYERARARTFASSHAIRLGDVLAGFDDGMRRSAAHARLIATVPPCHPRLIY